jgi:aminopeptidase
VELRKAITKAGGHVILKYFPHDEARYNFSRDFYELAQSHQLCYAPLKYFEGLVEDADHGLTILSNNPRGLEGVNSKNVSMHTNALTKLREFYTKKEQQGKFTWTLALYGTPELATEAGLSERQYWNQIIKACFLDKKEPKKVWQQVYKNLKKYKEKLNTLKANKLHIKGPDANLWVNVGAYRQWLIASGPNMPSFEIYTSPDWRGTEGWIRFNQPLYYGGNKIEGVELVFKNGRVVKFDAKTGKNTLSDMIRTENADKVGEFSLTDRRHSKITKFMANTLYDENTGGRNGNTHIALGNAYTDTCLRKGLSPKDWDKLGFNKSSVHTDIISTAPRIVTAYLEDGSSKVIYKDGQFNL